MAQTELKKAKVFKNGRSQAVRLPAEFRFDSAEVYIRRDEATGHVILSQRPTSWDGFFESTKGIEFPDDFLNRRLPDDPDRDPF